MNSHSGGKNIFLILFLSSNICSVNAETTSHSAQESKETPVISKEDHRQQQCMKAFGDSKFCNCLDQLLSPGLTFSDYVFVITQSKTAVGYDILPEENQRMIDTAYTARQKCVQ